MDTERCMIHVQFFSVSKTAVQRRGKSSGDLHHQGDVELASYAAVPHIGRIQQKSGYNNCNHYALIGVTELCRGVGKNPPLPEWLAQAYWDA